MEKNRKYLPPEERDWLEPPEENHLDASTKAFIIGIIIIFIVIFLVYVSPWLMGSLLPKVFGNNSFVNPVVKP